ncbi:MULTISPECIES: DUF6438 domain-containing protein [unclassified Empedobacter]|uniref:DUF6438 domain-containing protein n=1 Tax=unclassified Empedobacter TaxID=2643773 RepID=UPI0025C42E10|nr:MULTISPECIES: DUF6438 domain-containing protein [unclassified Empedobacter]
MKYIYILILILSFNACKNNSETDNKLLEQIQGVWSTKMAVLDPVIYKFDQDSIYNNKGYYDGIYETYGIREHKKFIPTKFLGNSIKFNVKDSTVHYFDSISKPKPFFKILSINKEEMVIKYNNDSSLDTLGRRDNNTKNPLDYDQIIYTTSGCYGSCSIINIAIQKNGTIISGNEAFNGKKGVFEGKLDKKFHQFLEQKINDADLLSLKDNYEEQITDQSEDLLLVIKENKIIKSIRIYAYPINFSYSNLELALSYSVSLMSNKKKYHESEYFPLLSLININGKQLSKAQTFLFWTELMKHPSNKISIKNQQTYKTQFYYYYFGGELGEINPCKLLSIKGNGQQFELTFENNQKHYYDLGYNFIQRYIN